MHNLLSFEDWLMSEYALDYDSFSDLDRYEKNSIKDAYNAYCSQNSDSAVDVGGK